MEFQRWWTPNLFFCFQHQFSAFATLVSGFGSGSILITTRWARGPPTSYKWSNGVITSISTVISSVIRVFFVFKQNHTTPNTQCISGIFPDVLVQLVGKIHQYTTWSTWGKCGNGEKTTTPWPCGWCWRGFAAFGQVMIQRKFLDGISSLQMFLDHRWWKGWSLTVPFFFGRILNPHLWWLNMVVIFPMSFGVVGGGHIAKSELYTVYQHGVFLHHPLGFKDGPPVKVQVLGFV